MDNGPFFRSVFPAHGPFFRSVFRKMDSFSGAFFRKMDHFSGAFLFDQFGKCFYLCYEENYGFCKETYGFFRPVLWILQTKLLTFQTNHGFFTGTFRQGRLMVILIDSWLGLPNPVTTHGNSHRFLAGSNHGFCTNQTMDFSRRDYGFCKQNHGFFRVAYGFCK